MRVLHTAALKGGAARAVKWNLKINKDINK